MVCCYLPLIREVKRGAPPLSFEGEGGIKGVRLINTPFPLIRGRG